ncbi:MAG TPA: hypothetical protein VF773_15995, partial [Verrucomicrobiae bacterium]
AIRVQAARCGNAQGFTVPSLTRKYYAFVRSNGDWTVLVNKAKAGPAWWNTDEPVGLPAEFIQFWKQLCERNQRKCKPAHRELLRIWRFKQDSEQRVYKTIPGYAEWPSEDRLCGHPAGWSYENLQRHAPDDFELAAARKGMFAASMLARQVRKTRADLQVGEFILFDDQEYDIKVNWPGNAQRKAMRPLGLNALDLFSGCCFAYGLKPTLVSEDGTRQKLKEIDMLWFVVHVLTTYGFNLDRGTRFVVEHGTAAIRPDFEERIRVCTGGGVTIDRSGIQKQPSLAALFDGASKGNPRFKAPLESFFNLVRNEMAMIPGQTGNSRDNCPDELHGREVENNRLLLARTLLSADQAEQLRMPVWSWHQFQQFAMEVYQRINRREDHDLEGWEVAGLVARECRLAPELPWMDQEKLLAIEDTKRAAINAIVQADPTLRRVRRMTPHEVFTRDATRLQKIDQCLLPDLLGPDFGQVRKVRSGVIEIKDQELSPEPMYFSAWTQGAKLRNGDEYRVFLNPYNPNEAVITTVKDNRFVGILPRQDIPSWSDQDGIRRQLGASRAEVSQRLAEIGVRHVDRARERIAANKHNTQVLAGKPVTEAQKEKIRATVEAAERVEPLSPISADEPLVDSGESNESAEPSENIADLLR